MTRTGLALALLMGSTTWGMAQQATDAATRLGRPSETISARRSGHIAAMPVTMIPTEAKLVKPHSA